MIPIDPFGLLAACGLGLAFVWAIAYVIWATRGDVDEDWPDGPDQPPPDRPRPPRPSQRPPRRPPARLRRPHRYRLAPRRPERQTPHE